MKLLILGLLCLIYLVEGRPNGSPMDSCFYMTPRHIHPHTYRKVFPTRAMGLYNITTSADVFRPDRPIRVTLWGPPFKGFMMVAAEEGAKDWPTGIFYSEDGSAKRLDCLGRGDTVTHQNNSYKDSVSVLWYGPENTLSEQVQFVATVVVNLTIYYTNIKSGFLRLDPTLHAQGGGEGAVGPVTMDPWLAGETATRAPWWGYGGRGGGRGSWGGLSSLLGGSSSGQGWGSSSYQNSGWGSNSYGTDSRGGGGSGSSSWWQERGNGYGSPSNANSWGNGGWQQWGEPSSGGNTSSTAQQGSSQSYQPTSPATTKQSKSEVWSWNWNSRSDPAQPSATTTTPAPPPPSPTSPTTSNPQYAPSWSDNRSLQSTNIWAKLLEFILNSPSVPTGA